MDKLCTSLSSKDYFFANVQLARSLGRTAATLLSKIHYWLQKDGCGIFHNNQKFIYNTVKEWSEQLGVSQRQIYRAIETLRELDLIEVKKLARHKAIRTNYYTINYENVNSLYNKDKSLEMSASSCQNDRINNKNSGFSFSKSNKSKTKDSKKKKNVTQNQNAQTDDISQTKTKENPHRDDQKTNTTIQQMVDVWKNIFPNSPVQLTKDLSRFLYAAYKNKFDSDLNLWKHYCQTIETSSYLTSKNFKLRLSWAVSFKTIDRIKVGELGVKSIPVEGEKEKLEQEIMAEIAEISEPDKCKQMRLTLVSRYGSYVYNAWIRNVQLFEYEEKIYYKAQTEFAQNYIENNFGRLIRNPSKTTLEKIEHHLTQKDGEISVQKELKIAATGQTEEERDTCLAEETRAILEEIERLEEEDICKMIRSVILKLHDVETYVSLLRPANLSIENGLLKVDTFSDLHQEQITKILDNLPFLDNFKL